MSRGGCGLDTDKLIAGKSISAVYPLPDTEERREKLFKDWCAAWKMPWVQAQTTVHRIQQYFGPQLGIDNACK